LEVIIISDGHPTCPGFAEIPTIVASLQRGWFPSVFSHEPYEHSDTIGSEVTRHGAGNISGNCCGSHVTRTVSELICRRTATADPNLVIASEISEISLVHGAISDDPNQEKVSQVTPPIEMVQYGVYLFDKFNKQIPGTHKQFSEVRGMANLVM
jgi:hypothetical protein